MPETALAVSLTDRFRRFEEKPWSDPRTAIVIAALVLALDWVTGPYIRFPVLFIFPVMLLAWNCSAAAAIRLVVVLALLQFGFHFVWETPETALQAGITALMRCVVMSLLAWVTAALAISSRALRQRVQALEGILPICMYCKSIRDDAGNWKQLEAYVAERSKAQFSHGVCDCCMEKLHPEAARALKVAPPPADA